LEKRDGGAGLVEALDHDPSQALGQHRLHSPLEVGRNVELPVSLTVGIAESVTVTAATPLVDRKATGTTTNITSDELTKIPASRDPFALMRSVPGVLVDRVNIGGNETGQQSNFVSKGTRPQDAVWTLDGVAITDMTLTGTSPTYFNWDNFEAIHVATAGQAIDDGRGPGGGAVGPEGVRAQRVDRDQEDVEAGLARDGGRGTARVQ